MVFPRHPGETDETGITPKLSGRTKLIVAVIALVLGTIVVLHLTGVVGR